MASVVITFKVTFRPTASMLHPRNWRWFDSVQPDQQLRPVLAMEVLSCSPVNWEDDDPDDYNNVHLEEP